MTHTKGTQDERTVDDIMMDYILKKYEPLFMEIYMEVKWKRLANGG